jgi:NAD(P)H dehydrogenase (quinone)
MAEAIAVVLTTSGHENKEYALAAETAFSFAEIADLISEITGTAVAYSQTDIPLYVSQLVQLGVSGDDAPYLSRFAGAIAKGEFETNKSDVEQLLGRSPISLKDFLMSIYGK